MLAAYMEHIHNNNLEIRIVGDKRSLQYNIFSYQDCTNQGIILLCQSRWTTCQGLQKSLQMYLLKAKNCWFNIGREVKGSQM